jgi:hypothetical protein
MATICSRTKIDIQRAEFPARSSMTAARPWRPLRLHLWWLWWSPVAAAASLLDYSRHSPRLPSFQCFDVSFERLPHVQ